MSNKTIHRTKQTHSFTISPNNSAQDNRLQADTRGVLWYLLSLPENWEVNVDHLKDQMNVGTRRIYRIIKELIEYGYMKNRTKHRNEKGQWVWTNYEVYDIPMLQKPHNGNRHDGDSNTDESKIKKVHSQESTDQQSTEEEKNKETPTPVPVVEEKESPQTEAQAITSLIAAWLDANKSLDKKAYSKKGYRVHAAVWHENGITPRNVSEFIRQKKRDDFWKSKSIPFQHITDNIMAWLETPAGKASAVVLNPPRPVEDDLIWSDQFAPTKEFDPEKFKGISDPDELVNAMLEDIAND